MTHTLTVSSRQYPYRHLMVSCSCGTWRLHRDDGVTLDELNRLAHEHIEASDRKPIVR